MFYNLLKAPRTVSNTYAQVAWVQPCANHVQQIERLSRASVMLRATWYEGTAQLFSLTELKSHLFEFYFIGWTIKPTKEGMKPEYPEKTPGDELQSFSLWRSKGRPQLRYKDVCKRDMKALDINTESWRTLQPTACSTLHQQLKTKIWWLLKYEEGPADRSAPTPSDQRPHTK